LLVRKISIYGALLLDPKVEKFAKDLFREYYSKVDAELIAPPRIESREFGFGDFEKKIAYRHFEFKNAKALKGYMVDNAPPFVSYSSAEYENPDARPMENKIWKGSELIFDLDATDLRLPCQETHGRSWVCDICMDSVKRETIRLVEDFLIPDFGFADREISVNFSGNRGYHVHVSDSSVFVLDSKARRSISEYIAGIGINPVSFFPTIGQRGAILKGPRPTDAGWGGKFAKGMISALNSGEDALANLGIERTLAKRLVKNRADIIFGIGNGNWDKVRIPRKADFWANVIKNMAIKQSDSIDKNVTNDTHHLLRLPNTIHGDTGLVGKKISSTEELAAFSPMKDAIAYKGKSVKIHVSKAPSFVMNEETYGPYENSDVEIPVYAALYLLLKRNAVLK
jgi:DNA primase small subunit